MIEQPDTPDMSDPMTRLAATWQDHPVVRMVLFGAVFAFGLVAIDVSGSPRTDDLRFLWMAIVPFALAFVVRHRLWPVAAVAGYYAGALVPNAVYDEPLPLLGTMQPDFPGITALAGMGIVWTVQGFREGYAMAAPPPVAGPYRAYRLRERVLAAAVVYALGFAVILPATSSSLSAPVLVWLVFAPFLLSLLAPAWLWPGVAGLVASVAVGWLLWTSFPPAVRLPVAAAGTLFLGTMAWTMAGRGFDLAEKTERLREDVLGDWW